MERRSLLPLLSGLLMGMVIMYVVGRYSGMRWKDGMTLIFGLLGGLGVAAELVRLTWVLSQGGREVKPELERPGQTESLPPLPTAPPAIPSLPERAGEVAKPVPQAEALLREVRSEAECQEPVLPAESPASDRLALESARVQAAELTFPADRLTALWNLYLAQGSGLFSVRGLKRQLEKGSLASEVIPGESVGLSDSVAAVDLKDEWGRLYLVPSFTRSTLAVADWFDAPASVARTALVRKLLRPAILGQSTEGWKCIRRGAIE